ncbi:MAG: polysaccharide pyruvyl transferase family protein [Cyanobacteria bacterium J06598_1]
MKLFSDQCLSGQLVNQQPSLASKLNSWLWPQLDAALGTELFGTDADQAIELVGSGALGYDTLRSSGDRKQLVIFGTGLSSAPALPAVPLSWDIRCVRGPLSADRLGLPVGKAITDAGLLVSLVFEASSEREGCSFIPQMQHASEAGESWQRICEQSGIRYIDPRWPIEQVLRAIASSERVLAESVTGAIMAEALRIPWIPIASSPRVCAFEWQDWCTSLNVFYHPYRLPALKSYRPWALGFQANMHALKHWFGAVLEGPVSTSQYELLAAECVLAQRLANIAKQAPSLSREAVFVEKVDALQTSFGYLCQQYAQDAIACL